MHAIQKCVRESGADPITNHLLQRHLDAARKLEIPNQKIQDLLHRLKHPLLQGDRYVYEVKWKNIFLLVEALSDNRMRTLYQVKHMCKEHGGMFCDQPGHVRWLFRYKGILDVMAPLTDAEGGRIMEAIQTRNLRISV